jgi:hypothetical protein
MKLSGRYEIPAICAALAIARLGLPIATTAIVMKFSVLVYIEHYLPVMMATMIVGFILDVVIAASMSYYLSVSRSGILQYVITQKIGLILK